VVIALKLKGSVLIQSLNVALQQVWLRGSNVSLPSNAAMRQFRLGESTSYIFNLSQMLRCSKDICWFKLYGT
jgi:hypothetical protein